MSSEKSLTPQIRFKGFTEAWEQRKFLTIYRKNDERNDAGLSADKTLSVATMTFNCDGNGASAESLPNYKRLRIGDVAFEGHTNKEFSFGRFVLNDAGDGIMSPRFTCLRPITKQDYSFWKHYIHSEKVMKEKLVNSTKSGTMMNELVIEDFLNESILIPSLEEQKKIGFIFKSLTNLITLHQRKLDALKKIKSALLEKMFPKDGSDIPEIRFTGFTEAWEQRKLGDIATKQTSKNINSTIQEPFTNSAEQGVVSQYDYFDHGITNVANISNYFVICPDDFVYNPRISVTAPCGPINRNRLNRPGIMSPLYTIFRADQCIAVTYLEYYFKTKKWHPFMFLEGNTGARSDRFSISDSTFFKMPIQIPSKAEQKLISEQLEALSNLITLHQRKLDALKKIKSALLEKMFV